MKKILIIVTICLSLCGCNKASKSNNEENLTGIEKIMEGPYEIVDVRTKEEYDTGHVNGALNIPYDEIDEKVDLDKEKTIIVYCRSGRRSSIAYETLKKLGYNVYDLGAYDKIDLPKE